MPDSGSVPACMEAVHQIGECNPGDRKQSLQEFNYQCMIHWEAVKQGAYKKTCSPSARPRLKLE